jgi:hypothetical protein
MRRVRGHRMSMTRKQMDALVDEHFRFEAMDDVDGS